MHKFILLVILTILCGCKDKYEKALDAVKETSMSVRKCQLKYLANEKPSFPCGHIEHNIAIEEARIYGINENRIKAAVNSGKLQINKISPNLIRKGNYFKTASDYKSNAEMYRQFYLEAQNELRLYEAGKRDDFHTVRKTCNKMILRNYINSSYNPVQCKIDLENRIKKHQAESAIWLRKANGWEAASKKINSEY